MFASKVLTRIIYLLLAINVTNCTSFDYLSQLGGDVVNENAIASLISTVEDVVTQEMQTRATTMMPRNLANQIEYTLNLQNMPSNCSQRQKLKTQPANDRNARVKKCCPRGESLVSIENQNEQLCGDSTIEREFKPNIINVILYDHCIEDTETEMDIDVDIGNPCNTSILYNDEEDIFYVLQDGSLLIMDEYANDTYSVERSYCIDVDIYSGRTYAVVCITSIEEHLKRGQIVTVAILTLISVPCLAFIAYVHLAIKQLRSLHGISLSLMSMCLAVGYSTHSLVHICNMEPTTDMGYVVQFFVLSYYFWYFCLCVNVVLNIWYVIPHNMTVTKVIIYSTLAIYCMICFGGPLLCVLLTLRKGLPGMPSYFIQGITESIRDSQRYFIPPVSTILFLSFTLLVVAFFGFQSIKKRLALTDAKNTSAVSVDFDETKYEEVKKDAKCIVYLGIIMMIAWILEIVTFYSPGPANYLVLLEILNGLQGLFILLIFVVVRRRRALIMSWWYDRGSHVIETVELSPINQQS